MGDINAVAKAFVNFYYETFDRNRADLTPLYKDVSMLSFEGQQFQGVKAIVEKLTELPFQRVEHRVQTIDAQPANPQMGAILVTVTGGIMFDDETKPQNFTQTFQLFPEGSSWFVFNDIFRPNLFMNVTYNYCANMDIVRECRFMESRFVNVQGKGKV